jgi:hypothetical protein
MSGNKSTPPLAKSCSVEVEDTNKLPVAQEVQHQPEPTMAPPPVPSNVPSAPPLDYNYDHTEQETKEEYQCPVCFDSIHPSAAAMRCDGSGGHPHYFHAHCLSSWVRACRQQNNESNCPVCRGGVQIHEQRLEQFLESAEQQQQQQHQQHGSNDSRHGESIMVGRSILQSIQSAPQRVADGWASLPSLSEITTEEVVEGASIVAGAGIGFWAGANGSALSTGSWMMDSELWERSSTTTKVATIVGYTTGLVYRWWNDSKNEEEEEENRRRRR